jgi:outer membrane lipoprotein-sorting protein
MRRLRSASTRTLALLSAAVVAVAVGAVGIAQAVGGASAPAPKPLASAIYDAAHAPAVAGITARIHFTNNLLPSGALPDGSASPVLTGADGRLWLTNDGRLRLELQSDSGDAQITSDGKTFSVYDAASKTVYTGTLPQDSKPSSGSGSGSGSNDEPTLDRIKQGLANLATTWDVSGAEPGTTADQPSYTVSIAPKDDGGLLGSAALAWDAANGTPLRAAVYAQGQSSPVLELKATEISFGKIAASDIDVKPPAGATQVQINPPAGTDAQGRPTTVHGLDAVQKQVDFTVSAPASLAGLPRKDVTLIKDGGETGALVTYGHGLGAIAVFEHKADAAGAGKQDLRLPQVNIDGATGTELPTALGTVVMFDRDGVSFTVLGSVQPVAAENAARGLG